jgi:hypothetical protein
MACLEAMPILSLCSIERRLIVANLDASGLKLFLLRVSGQKNLRSWRLTKGSAAGLQPCVVAYEVPKQAY